MKVKILVTIEAGNYTQKEMETYVRDAVRSWRKGGCPDDELFLKPDKHFTVKNVTNRCFFVWNRPYQFR